MVLFNWNHFELARRLLSIHATVARTLFSIFEISGQVFFRLLFRRTFAIRFERNKSHICLRLLYFQFSSMVYRMIWNNWVAIFDGNQWKLQQFLLSCHIRSHGNRHWSCNGLNGIGLEPHWRFDDGFVAYTMIIWTNICLNYNFPLSCGTSKFVIRQAHLASVENFKRTVSMKNNLQFV